MSGGGDDVASQPKRRTGCSSGRRSQELQIGFFDRE
jgi:hypothetical protein